MKNGFDKTLYYNSHGQSLIEAVIALAVLLIVLTAIALLMVTSLSNSTFLKNQNNANKYAQAGMEYIRSLKVNNDGITIDGVPNKKFGDLLNHYCMDASNVLTVIGAGLTPCATVNIDNTFIRNVKISPVSSSDECDTTGATKGTRVTISVKWSSGKCGSSNQYCHSSVVESCFTTRTIPL